MKWQYFCKTKYVREIQIQMLCPFLSDASTLWYNLWTMVFSRRSSISSENCFMNFPTRLLYAYLRIQWQIGSSGQLRDHVWYLRRDGNIHVTHVVDFFLRGVVELEEEHHVGVFVEHGDPNFGILWVWQLNEEGPGTDCVSNIDNRAVQVAIEVNQCWPKCLEIYKQMLVSF